MSKFLSDAGWISLVIVQNFCWYKIGWHKEKDLNASQD